MNAATPEHPQRPLSRRWILTGVAAATITAGGIFTGTWFNVFGDTETDDALTVTAAHDLAQMGEIYLIDIRRPDEWRSTGMATPAIPIDMRRDDFETLLRDILEATGDRPVALICARGVRSDRQSTRLKAAGFHRILDVPEGMLGSGAGPGYIASGLPLRQPTQAELDGKI